MRDTLETLNPLRIATVALGVMAIVAATFLLGAPAGAQPVWRGVGATKVASQMHTNQGARISTARRALPNNRGRSNRSRPSESPLLEAGFEHGLANWNVAGLGETMPTIDTGEARSGDKSGDFRLTGHQERSELILGGNGGDSLSGMVHIYPGDEYWYGFSFDIQKMVWGRPGAHNLIMQMKSDGTGSPEFGLQLWSYAGDDGHSGGRGLWSHANPDSKAPGGDRFLAPVGEDEWHDVAIHFKASEDRGGFYEIFLDGKLVETRSNQTMIVPGKEFAYIKDGLYRNGETLPGTSEILIDSARLGTTQESVAPH